MQIVRLVTAALLFSAALSAQQRTTPRSKPRPTAPKAAPVGVADLNQAYPLAEVAVEGNKQFPADQVIALSGVKQGQNVSKKDFDAAQQRLLATGLFEQVAYRFEAMPDKKAYRARFIVREIDQVFPFRFEAIDADEKAMREWLREREPLYRDGIPATEPVLRRLASLLDEYLVKQGKPIKVVGKLMPNAANRMEVVFQPASLPAIAEVRFRGNKSIPTVALQQAVAGAAVGALYTEERFRQILDASIRPLFEAEGRLRVAFPKIDKAQAADVKGLAVTVEVNEGAQYKLKDVTLSGDMAEDKGLLKAGRFRTGETANMTAVEEGVKDIQKSLRRRGYLKVDAKIARKIDDGAKTVDVIIDLDPGQQFRMGKLLIEGLDLETEPHIRKMWTLKSNQPFDIEYPDLFLAKMPEVLDSLGRTRSTVTPDAGTLKVDVTLHFEGEKKQPKKPLEQRQEQSAPPPDSGSPFPLLGFAESSKTAKLRGVLMDAACPAIQEEGNVSGRTVREKYRACKAKADSTRFALHAGGKLYRFDDAGNEAVLRQMRNEAFRASMSDRSGAPQWISVSVEGTVSHERLAVISVRR